MRKRWILVMGCFLLLGGCWGRQTNKYEPVSTELDTVTNIVNQRNEDPIKQSDQQSKGSNQTDIKPPKVSKVKLSAVGDIMVHRWQIWGAYDEQSDTYDFAPSFELIKPYLQDADITIGNLETTLAGKERGYQGFPYFNAPEVLASNLKEAGFDLLTTANNHSMDSFEPGILHTLKVLDEAGLDHVGTYATKEKSEEIYIETINEMKFAFIGYGYGTNGIPLPKGKPYMVNSWEFDGIKFSEKRLNEMYDKVKKAKELNPDFVVVMVHFGNEYQLQPNSWQKMFVDELFAAGADIILGSHPHVLQPFEIRKIKDEDGSERAGIVIYSMGNFISSQRATRQDPSPKDAGIIFSLHFEKEEGKEAVISEISLVPTWVQWAKKNGKDLLRVIPVDEALKNIELGKSSDFKIDEVNRMKQVQNFTVSHMVYNIDQSYEQLENFYRIPLNTVEK